MTHPLIAQVEKLTHAYVSKGGKDNRKQQRSRMLEFAEHAAGLDAHSMGQVGGKHVIRYWKTRTALSETTRYHHWLALCELWRLCGKTDTPPRPRNKPSLKQKLFGPKKSTKSVDNPLSEAMH